MLRRIAIALLALALIGPAKAAQTTLVTPSSPLTMAGLATFLNNALGTVATNYSGATPPAVCTGGTACTYQFWLDTSTSPRVLRILDGTSWVSIGSLNTSTHAFSMPVARPVNAQAGTTYTFDPLDCGKLVTFSNASPVAVTAPQPGIGSAFTDGCIIGVQNKGAGAVTITPTLSTIDGSSTKVFVQNQGGDVVSDGTNYQLQRGFGTVFSVALSMPAIFSVSGSPITLSGTLAATLATQSANTVWAGPSSGSAVAPTFRALVGADLPLPAVATLGGAFSKAAVASNWLRSLGTDGAFTASQPAVGDISGIGTIASQNASAVAITGGTIAGLTGLAIRDTSAAFDLTFAAVSSSALSAGRTLTFDVVNASRTVKLGGNLTTANDVIHAGNFATTITATATTNSTLPAGTHTLAGLDVANVFSGNNSFSGTTTYSGSLIVPMRVVTAAGAITVSATTDYFICVNKTSGAATTVNLPATPATGLTYLVKDCKGDAATNNITLTPAAGNIDGAGTYVMNVNRASVAITYTGSEWSIN